MIVLDSIQILAAVQRSLETHVLPELSDDFARVQVQSALKALAEVSDRLERGDPSQRSNQIIESEVAALAESVRATSPDFAAPGFRERGPGGGPAPGPAPGRGIENHERGQRLDVPRGHRVPDLARP
jgi:hypothetical protein